MKQLIPLFLFLILVFPARLQAQEENNTKIIEQKLKYTGCRGDVYEENIDKLVLDFEDKEGNELSIFATELHKDLNTYYEIVQKDDYSELKCNKKLKGLIFLVKYMVAEENRINPGTGEIDGVRNYYKLQSIEKTEANW